MDEKGLNEWFCREVLPLESSLTAYIRRNWRSPADVSDLRQEIYERVLLGARNGLPLSSRQFVYTTARHHLINRAKRAKLVSFDLVSDLEAVTHWVDGLEPERHVSAREELRRVQAGLEVLPARCREVVRLRKIEGLTTREVAERLGIGVDTVEKQITQGMRALVDYMLGGSGRIRRPPVPGRTTRRRVP